ncbi:MAG: phytanoyl-CoA dioxygenase family protein [Pseudomonadales bacterium]
MNSDPTQQLLKDGYTIVEDFLDDSSIASIAEKVQHVLGKLSNEHREAFKATGSLLNLNNYPQFAELIANPKVQEVMQQIGFDSYRWLSGYLISKPPQSPPLYWHQDWWGWSHSASYSDRHFGLGFMYYLTDTRQSNGALRVIPGSHRNWHSLHDLPTAHDEDLASAKDTDHPAFQSNTDERVIEVNVGSVVIMDSRLLHSAYANASDKERSLITLWYLPDFDRIPESFQKRFMMIYRQENLDVDIESEKDLSPTDWPSDAHRKVAHLLPDYYGTSQPERWVRSVSKEMMVR